MSYKNLIIHIRTISKHKRLVRKMCFKAGMYKQGLTHDLSKWSLCEMKTGAKYANGHKSPIDIERKEELYSTSWLHHFHKNKHHYEYWQDVSINENIPMPWKYVYESAIDRIAAAMNYQKEEYKDSSAYEYFIKGNDIKKMNEKTAERLGNLLISVQYFGLEWTLQKIKSKYFERSEKEFEVKI